MIKNIAIISVSVLLLLAIIVIGYITIFRGKHETVITKNNDYVLKQTREELKNRDIKIKELEENKIVITREILVEKTSEEKDEIIIKLQDENIEKDEIIKKDTEIITNLEGKLYTTNQTLKSKTYPKNSLSVFTLAGFDMSMNYDVYVGLTYRRMFFDSRFFVGGGLFFKPAHVFGGGISVEIGFNF